MTGEIGVLNVGAGDTKLSFDKSNPAECIRSGRIVTDMLRRGYALLIEVDDGNGGKTHVRATGFDEKVSEYIIADFDPEIAAVADRQEDHEKQEGAEGPAESPAARALEEEAPIAGKRSRSRGYQPIRVPAAEARGVAVARSAGG